MARTPSSFLGYLGQNQRQESHPPASYPTNSLIVGELDHRRRDQMTLKVLPALPLGGLYVLSNLMFLMATVFITVSEGSQVGF